MLIALTHPESAPPPSPPGRVWLSAAAVLLGVVGLCASIGFELAAIAARRLASGPAGAEGAEGPTPEEISRLVADLSADEWPRRSAATRRLIEIGEPALPQLRQAAREGDAEAAWRAQEAIGEIELEREEARGASAGPTR